MKNKQEKKPKRKSLSQPAVTVDRKLQWRSGIAFGLLALLRLLASFFPEERLWGISWLAYLPDWTLYLTVFAGLLFASPSLYPIFLKKAAWLERDTGKGIVLLIAIASGVLFWVFRMDTYFLGDGAVYLSEHFRLQRGLDVSGTVLYSTLSAPLSAWTLATISTLAWTLSGESGVTGNPQFAWWFSGALSGIVYVYIVLASMSRYSSEGALRLAWVSALLLTPGVLFFFGYVEYYTFLFVAATAYCIAADRTARGELSAWIPALLLALSIALHFMALLLLPGYLLLLFIRQAAARERSVSAARMLLFMAGGSLLAGGLWYFLSGTAYEGSRVILSIAAFGEPGAIQRYTLLHSAHLLDVVNMLLLAGAPALLALSFLRRRGMSVAAVVAAAHVLFLLFLLLFGYTGFGMARDWDVNTLFGVALAMFALVVLRDHREKEKRFWMAYMLSGAALVATLPWLAVNISTDASVQRFRHVMALDDELIPGDFALNGYEHLRKYYQSIGDDAGVAWAIERKIAMVGYPDDMRKYVLSAITTMRGGEREAAFAYTFAALMQRLDRMQAQGVQRLYEGTRSEFSEVFAETVLQAEYLALAGALPAGFASAWTDSLRHHDDEGGMTVILEALLHEARGLPPRDLPRFAAAARDIDGSATLATYSGRVLLAADRIDDAIAVLRTAIHLDEQFTLPSLYLGQALLQRDPPELREAATQLRRFLTTPEGHRIADAASARQLTDFARRLLDQVEQRLSAVEQR